MLQNLERIFKILFGQLRSERLFNHYFLWQLFFMTFPPKLQLHTILQLKRSITDGVKIAKHDIIMLIMIPQEKHF